MARWFGWPVDRIVRKSFERLDPYALRKEALDRRLSPSEIGRALFHLNQRRGFKSNRIISDSDHDERSSMKQGIKRLEVELESAGVRTLGELLAERRLGPGGGSVRFRPERKGSKNLYAFYPTTRSMIESEVDAIWKSQRRWHSDLLTDELLRKIKHILVDQRPLKPQVPRRCTALTLRIVPLFEDVNCGEASRKGASFFGGEFPSAGAKPPRAFFRGHPPYSDTHAGRRRMASMSAWGARRWR